MEDRLQLEASIGTAEKTGDQGAAGSANPAVLAQHVNGIARATNAPVIQATDAPVFQKDRHIKYWLRCLRLPLPEAYTSNDSNRMTLVFFTLSALDLLGVLQDKTSAAERQGWADWIYSCQHPHGGFRAFPGIDFGTGSGARPERSPETEAYDPANLPATYFALASLAILGDSLVRVRRGAVLTWLRRLQRAEGSFGQTLGFGGRVEGGMDTRFGYCAMVVRWMVGGGRAAEHADVDVDKLVACIKESETYSGGIADEPFHEAHAGFAFCALGALEVAGRLNTVTAPVDSSNAPSQPAALARWLLSRLTTFVDEEASDDEQDADADAGKSNAQDETPIPTQRDSQPPETFFDSVQWSGYNGRPNKLADTCYVFWAGGSLKILDALHLIDAAPVRRYLLERTQHPIMGGFGKTAGDVADIFHSYLGLAALAVHGLDSVETIGPKPVAAEGKTPSNADFGNADSGSAELNRLASSLPGVIQDGSPDAGKVLRNLDAALCFSVRAKRIFETHTWPADD